MAAPDRPTRVPTGPPSRAARNVVVGFLMVFVVAAYSGDLLLAKLIPDHPLIFIALNARNRNLVLASPHLDPWSFYSVAFVRLLVSDPLFFVLGRWYGDAGVKWMERKSPTFGRILRQAEGWFAKAAYPLVAIAPNNFICLFAGASGMSVSGFFTANVAGTVARLYLLRAVGDVLDSPIKDLTGWIKDNQLLVFAVSATVLAFTLWSERRAAGEGELGQLAHLDEELATASAADGADSTDDAARDSSGGDGDRLGAGVDEPPDGTAPHAQRDRGS